MSHFRNEQAVIDGYPISNLATKQATYYSPNVAYSNIAGDFTKGFQFNLSNTVMSQIHYTERS